MRRGKNESSRPLIFSANTGRIGTHTITSILDSSPAIRAEHEAEPVFSKLEYMVNAHDPDHLQDYAVKVKSILSDLDEPFDYYADPTNMFVKSWGRALLRHSPDFSEEIRLIYGHRSLTAMTRSYFEWGYVPGRHNEWMPPMRHPRHEFQYPFEIGRKQDTPEARHVWYGFEIYFRTLKLMDRYPAIPVMEFGTEDFGSGVSETLFDWLDCPMPDEAPDIEQTKRNTTPQQYKENPIKQIGVDLVEEAYDTVAEQAKAHGKNYGSTDELPFPTP